MRLERPMRGLVIGSLALLVLVLLSLAVAALSGPVAVLILIGVLVVAYLGWRFASRVVRRGTVLEIDLDKGVVEQTPANPIDRALNSGSLVLRDVTDALERAAKDDRVVGLIARLGNGKLGIATAQELRDAVHRFRRSGKRAVAYSETFGEGNLAIVDYYLAASFDEIHLMRSGSVGIEGLIARTPFLRNLLDRIHVTPDLSHREEYKAAKYLLTESEYLEPHREATQAIIDDHFEQIVLGVAEDRSMSPDQVRSLVDKAPLTGPEALEAGLVDTLSYRDEAYEAAKGADGKSFLYTDRYLKKAGRPHRKGERIALIHGTGSIHRGKSSFDPMTRSSSMGSDDVTAAFRKAIDDKKVKAIVFRVDSPGGSAVASDLIGREVTRARAAEKPVVVSMGQVAGSGGYWVSAPADKIVAQPGTITGSIGVVSGKLARGETWRSIGVDFGQLQKGRNATTWDPLEPFTESERERNEAFLDWIYDDFLAHVAKGRSMDVENVRPIAKGRVWTGARAKELGLVDELGGLHEAVEVARQLAGIDPEDRIEVRPFPQPRTMPLPKREENSEPVEVALRSLLETFEVAARPARGGHLLTMPLQWWQ